MEDKGVANAIERDLVVLLIAPCLECIDPAALFQLGQQLAVIEAVGAVGIGRVSGGSTVVVGDKYASSDAPVGWIGRPAAAFAALDVFSPMALDPFGHQKIRGDGIPASHRGLGNAFRERRDHCYHNWRMRLLQWF